MSPFPVDWEQIPSGPLNLSFLLDKPAGDKGSLQCRDGHFYTPSGKRFRIWGVNLTAGACYPEKREAPEVARLLASLGINAVRFHFLDSNWGGDRSVFRTDTNTTRVLNPVQLDRLDYFVSELKQQGIYSNFNLNVGRTYREGDGVPYYNHLGMAKAATLFDGRLIRLQKEYAMQLLTHINPYTGNAYRNEPALAFLEIVNENSLVEAWFGGRLLGTQNSARTGTWSDIPEYYAEELTRQYNQWLKSSLPEKHLEAVRKGIGLKEGEPVPRLRPGEMQEADSLRFYAEARFIMETERAFYTGMYRYLKDSVGVSQWVAGNSDHNHYKSGYALLSSLAKLDFVDGHVYWQHPKNFTDPKTGKRGFTIENTPMVNDPGWSTVAQLSRTAVEGKPYTVSETNHPYPNEYASEGIPILAAYALLQDWDGIWFYTFEHDDPTGWKNKVPGHFDMLHDPVKIANLAACAPMFHRGDILSARSTIFRSYGEKELMEGIRKDVAPKPFFTPGFPPNTPLISKTRIRSFSGGKNSFPEPGAPGTIVSETEQLKWDVTGGKGLVTVNSEHAQAMIGYSSGMSVLETDHLRADLETPFASLVLTSLDGKSIGKSRKMLLAATSTSIMNGAEWNRERTSLVQWGSLPFVIEPVKGMIRLTIPEGLGQVLVTPLDGAGQPAGATPSPRYHSGSWEITIGKVPTVWYLIEVKQVT